MAIEKARMQPEEFHRLLGTFLAGEQLVPEARRRLYIHILWLQQHAGIMRRSAEEAECKAKAQQRVVVAAEELAKVFRLESAEYGALLQALCAYRKQKGGDAAPLPASEEEVPIVDRLWSLEVRARATSQTLTEITQKRRVMEKEIRDLQSQQDARKRNVADAERLQHTTAPAGEAGVNETEPGLIDNIHEMYVCTKCNYVGTFAVTTGYAAADTCPDCAERIGKDFGLEKLRPVLCKSAVETGASKAMQDGIEFAAGAIAATCDPTDGLLRDEDDDEPAGKAGVNEPGTSGAMDALRRAGGDAWDDVADPEALLDRESKGNADESAIEAGVSCHETLRALRRAIHVALTAPADRSATLNLKSLLKRATRQCDIMLSAGIDETANILADPSALRGLADRLEDIEAGRVTDHAVVSAECDVISAAKVWRHRRDSESEDRLFNAVEELLRPNYAHGIEKPDEGGA